MSPTNPTHRDEPFSVEAFLEFCRSKPAEEEFDRGNNSACALAQFGFAGLYSGNHQRAGVPKRVYEAAVYDWSPHKATFGSLVTRLERALAEQVSA